MKKKMVLSLRKVPKIPIRELSPEIQTVVRNRIRKILEQYPEGTINKSAKRFGAHREYSMDEMIESLINDLDAGNIKFAIEGLFFLMFNGISYVPQGDESLLHTQARMN